MPLQIMFVMVSCSKDDHRTVQQPDPFHGTTEVTEKMVEVKGISVLTAVRSGEHPEYDRIVFEFEPAVPSYRLEYLERPVYHCGSGEEISISGNQLFQIRFSATQAHNDEGKPTVRPISFSAQRNVQDVRLVCDFEGEVIYLIGLRQKTPYRSSQLKDPNRLVVDLKK